MHGNRMRNYAFRLCREHCSDKLWNSELDIFYNDLIISKPRRNMNELEYDQLLSMLLLIFLIYSNYNLTNTLIRIIIESLPLSEKYIYI